MTRHVLHYAPDNASLIIRLLLEELGVPFETRLVDRKGHAQRSPAYRALNPVGRIPVLETPHGAMFETAAIALWLADTHRDAAALAPLPTDPGRGAFLSWLFFMSNTLHSEMRTLFYTDTIAGPDPLAQAAVAARTRHNLTGHFALLETECARGRVLGGAAPTICDFYAAALMRWPVLYPLDSDRSWFEATRWPCLLGVARSIERRPSSLAAIAAEGLGPTPFSDPHLPNPPEGSAV